MDYWPGLIKENSSDPLKWIISRGDLVTRRVKIYRGVTLLKYGVQDPWLTGCLKFDLVIWEKKRIKFDLAQ